MTSVDALVSEAGAGVGAPGGRCDVRARWLLRTRSTLYAVSALSDGSGIVLDHWAEAWDAPLSPEPAGPIGFALPSDVMPLEYASDAQLAVSFPEMLIDHDDGTSGAVWAVAVDGTRFRSDAAGDLLEVLLRDERDELSLELSFATSRRHDVIRRHVSVCNGGADEVVLRRVFSAAWNPPVGQRVRVDYLSGAWGREFQRRSVDVEWGSFGIGSRQGVTGLLFSPVVTLTPSPGRHDGHRPAAPAYGVALEWSGSWRLQVDSSAITPDVRISCGLDEDTTLVTLDPGARFTTLDSRGVFSPDVPEGVTRAWHDFQRADLTWDPNPTRRPIVYNSWRATSCDVHVDQQRQVADIAARIGAEVFVVDDSDLFRRHPDWIFHAPGRALRPVRNQFVLDLGRDDVVSWLEDALRSLVTSARITYLKWDMNRPASDGGRLGDPHAGEWPVQHTRAYYRVLEMIRREFPHVTVEACSSGGGRLDNAVLARSDVVWTSDNTGGPDRLVIQDGFLRAHPSWVMGSWVSDDAGFRDRCPVSLAYRFAVAMCGVLGIVGNILAWPEADRAAAAQMVALDKDIRPIILHGAITLHGDPEDNLYCVEFAGPDADRRTVLVVFDRSRARERPRVYPSALRPDLTYRVNGTHDFVTATSGRAAGVSVPFAGGPDADILVLRPTTQAES